MSASVCCGGYNGVEVLVKELFMPNQKSRRGQKKSQKAAEVPGALEDRSPKQRKQTDYPKRQPAKPDKRGGAGAGGRQQGGSGVAREHD